MNEPFDLSAFIVLVAAYLRPVWRKSPFVFDSELVRAMRAGDNTVVDGDPAKIVTATDLWTFARRLPSRNPNWTVVATEGWRGDFLATSATTFVTSHRVFAA